MEKSIKEGRSVCVTPTQQSRRIYLAPKVLQVVVMEAVMSVPASLTGSLNEPEEGISAAKEQDFSLYEEIEVDPWSESE